MRGDVRFKFENTNFKSTVANIHIHTTDRTCTHTHTRTRTYTHTYIKLAPKLKKPMYSEI